MVENNNIVRKQNRPDLKRLHVHERPKLPMLYGNCPGTIA